MQLIKVSLRLLSLGLAVFGLTANFVYADDAQVLPQGRFRLRLASAYTTADNNYGSTGDSTPFGSTFTRSLDAKLVSALSPDAAALIKQMNAIAPGSGSALTFGSLNTQVQTTMVTNVMALEYGLTERLSVGIILPIYHGEIDVEASSTPDSKFEGMIAAMQKRSPQQAAQLAKLRDATSIAGLNQVLASRFAYSSGLQSTSATGIGDIELGGKYNYVKMPRLLMTAKAGLRLPTGRTADENKLIDLSFGDGQTDIGAYNYIDYRLLSNLSFTLENGYVFQLPDTKSTRVPVSADLPVGAAAVELDRNSGDYWESGLEANWTFLRNLTLSSKYRFLQKFKDSYEVPNGVDAALLEEGTDEILQEGTFTLEYSSIPDVRAGTARIPYAVSGFYTQPYAAQNRADQRTFGLQLKAYF